MKNGFVLIGFLFLLPVLLIAALMTFFGFNVVKNYTAIQNNCRKHVLEAQQIMGQSLQALLNLNPTAEALRLTEKMLRMKIAASTPYDVAYWIALLAANLKAQAVLRAQQQALILQSEMRAQYKLMDFVVQSGWPQLPSAKLQVTAKPAQAIAPDYYTAQDFERVQSLKVSWRVNALALVFSKISLLNIPPQTMRGSCSATLKQGGDAWNPQINEVKFSSSAWSSLL